MIKVVLIIVFLIILILIFMPLRLNISIDNNKFNVDLFLFGIFNIRIDVDEFVNKYLKNDKKKISIKKIIAFISSLKYSKKMYNEMMKKTIVESLYFEVFEDFENPNKFIFYHLLWNNMKYLFESKFKLLKERTYKINYNENESFNINIILRTYLFLIVYVSVKHIKEILKSIKYIKEENKHESSN